MKNRSIQLAAVLLCSMLAGAGAYGQEGGPAPGTQQADKALLYRLTRQVRRVDRDTAELMNRAMAEARENEGKANPATKARLLSLRDERDRVFARMLILSMRHGWEIPDFDKPTVTPASRKEAEDSIFGAIDVLVRRQFAAEARRVARKVQMPIVSLVSMSD